jgi:hypothetical protein
MLDVAWYSALFRRMRMLRLHAAINRVRFVFWPM